MTEADETHVLRVVETATDSDGGPSTTSTSAPTAAVTDITLLPTITAGSDNPNILTGTVTFNVTFAEAVATVVTGDFTLFGTATTSLVPASITSVTGSGTNYTVTATYTELTNAGRSLGLNFVNTSNLVHDTETGESGNLAVATNYTTPQFSSLAPAGVAGQPINLALKNLPAADGGPVTLSIAGMPSDWQLNQGTNLGNGTWTVQTSDLSALAVLTAAAYAGATVLNVTESWANADGSTGTALVSDNVEAYAPGAPIFAWSGNDTLTGAGSNDLFVFAQPIGNDTIYNFNVATDKIDLTGFAGIASFADIAVDIAGDGNGNAIITLGAGETITLHRVDAASLTAGNFVFNQTPVVENPGDMTVSDGAMLPLGGTIDNTGTIALTSTGDETDLQIIGDGVTLQGGGQVILSDSHENVIFGATSATTLTNIDNTISGAGQIGIGDGNLTLVNEAAGTIDANFADGVLTLNTGNTILNAGLLEATNGGTLQIIDNVVQFRNAGSERWHHHCSRQRRGQRRCRDRRRRACRFRGRL